MSPPAEGQLESGHGPARNALFSMAGQSISAVFTTVLTLFLLRKLGPEDYGVFALVISVGTIALLISDFGISASAARFTAEAPEDRNHAAAVLRSALGLKLVASILMMAAIFVLAPVIADAYDTPEMTLPLRLVSIAVAAQGFGGLFLTWFTALGRISLNLRYAIVESAFETTASIALVLGGAGVAGAAAGRAVGFGIAGLFAIYLAAQVVGWNSLRHPGERGFHAQRIFRYGAVLVVINGAFAVLDRIDVLIIGAFLGPASAGMFEAAARILTLLQYPGIAVGAGFSPRLAVGRRTTEDKQRYEQAFRMSVLLYLLMAAPTLVWAEPIVGLLLGSAYSDSAAVLQALTPTVIFLGLGQVLATGVDYIGQARRRMPLAIGALVINTVIDLILVPRMGITAGALGSGVALAFYVGGHIRILQQAVGVSFRPALLALLRGSLAFAVAALILFAFGTDHLNPIAWVLGPAFAAVGFVATLVGVGELSPRDVTSGVRLVRTRLLPGT